MLLLVERKTSDPGQGVGTEADESGSPRSASLNIQSGPERTMRSGVFGRG